MILPQPRTEFMKTRFSYSGAAHWLPYEAKTTLTVQSFKTITKQRIS